MARAYSSIIIEAPVEAVWAAIRDFGALASWHPAIASSAIEDGKDADAVGCIRSLQLKDGGHVRERLLMLDDSRYSFSYNFETPAFPVGNYVSTVELIPVTNGDAHLRAVVGELRRAAGGCGQVYGHRLERRFRAGPGGAGRQAEGRCRAGGCVRWQGLRPAKVFCSSVLHAPRARVWQEMRDFAGMDGWHPEITDMHMLAGARADKVSGVREFSIGGGQLHEQLTYLSDPDCAFRYKINASGMPWMNYHAGAQLYPVTASDTCFAVWTADWTASANDDLRLIPMVHNDVFQLAFDTLDAKLNAAS